MGFRLGRKSGVKIERKAGVVHGAQLVENPGLTLGW